MDPVAALNAADQAISDIEPEAANDSLNDYWEWRLKGGFEPFHSIANLRGDEYARQIKNRLDSIYAQQSLPVIDAPKMAREFVA